MNKQRVKEILEDLRAQMSLKPSASRIWEECYRGSGPGYSQGLDDRLSAYREAMTDYAEQLLEALGDDQPVKAADIADAPEGLDNNEAHCWVGGYNTALSQHCLNYED